MDEEKTKYLNFLCQELFGRNFLRKKCNCFFQLRQRQTEDRRGRQRTEAIFGVGRDFPEELHPGLSISSEGKG